ncbi:MAG: STAS domain-containing protein [Oscillospiraceae bacterium]|nr:STAS domain-containing protein [Oscillospiraceae bacterium]
MLKTSSVEIEYSGGTLTCRLLGEVDHHNAPHLREEIDQEILAQRPEKVALYLGDIDFMDSAGLGLILGRYTKAQNIGAKLVLIEPTEQVEKIIRLAGTHKFIEVIKSTKEKAK